MEFECEIYEKLVYAEHPWNQGSGSRIDRIEALRFTTPHNEKCPVEAGIT